MKKPSNPVHWIAALTLLGASLAVQAHGDEPHGDEPHPVGVAAVTGPRFEAATEAFELVGRLEAGTLTLFINRFENSEPVLQAEVELESGELKARATYQEAQGSYVVSEPQFVQALSRPGIHPLVVTVASGDEADLLEATLNIDAAGHENKNPSSSWPIGLAGAAVLAAAGVGVVAMRKRRSNMRGEGK